MTGCRITGSAVWAVFWGAAAAAQCVAPFPLPPVAEFEIAPPAPPDPASHPEQPACLSGLSSPIQQNCSESVIADYGRALAEYLRSLQEHVAAADVYAAEAARRANGLADHARAAAAHADAVYAYAVCESEAIRAEGR